MTSDAESAPRLRGASDPMVAAYLARVRLLSPAEWGALDASAARYTGSWPDALWRRLRIRRTLLVVPAALLVTAARALAAALPDVLRRGGTVDDADASAAPRTEEVMHVDDDAVGAFGELWRVAEDQPLGPGAGVWVARLGLAALVFRDLLTDEQRAALYEPVADVIPVALLERPPERLAPPSGA